MTKQFYLVLVLLFSILNIYSQQEVCESPDENLVDVNSITKCTITSKKKKRKKESQIRVKVSASRRYFKKRKKVKRKAVESLSSSEAINIKKIANTETANSKTPLVVENTRIISKSNHETEINSLKSNIDILKEKLSKEEVTKASKLYYIDRIPEFKNCKKVKRGDRLDCFNTEMIKHINKHFRYPSEAVRNQIEGEVWIRFIIDKNGFVRNIKTLGPDGGEILNDEAKRVVSKLPHFEPGKNKGKRVSVKYGFPINFSLEE